MNEQEMAARYQELSETLHDLAAMFREETDSEMRAYIQNEYHSLWEERKQIEAKLRLSHYFIFDGKVF